MEGMELEKILFKKSIACSENGKKKFEFKREEEMIKK